MDIRGLIAEMTLEEKAALCSGKDFWHLNGLERLGIPDVMMTDGPHGLRKVKESYDRAGIFDSVPSTCFPSAAGLACSWDRSLLREVGVALGQECQAEGVAILLGPAANIKRSPLCGRNFEYFSEDPYLSSEMAASHITGVQSEGVGTSLKHFAVNNQEHRRMSVDAVVDERTLREIYLASFEGAVKQGKPWTVMSSYNRVNGTYASESPFLLTQVLRAEWGYEGFVMSDWGAVDERDVALTAGLDLEMPSSYGVGANKVVTAVQSGRLTEKQLDEAVEHILKVVAAAIENKQEKMSYDIAAHHQLARRVASESAVLLKNDGGILPLNLGAKIAVIGEFAQKPRFQGGGSSHVMPTQLDTPLEEMRKLADDAAAVVYAPGYTLASDDVDETMARQARELAQSADVVVVFAGLPDRYESEGYDRDGLSIPINQDRLIGQLAEGHENVVVVLMNGSPITMPWAGQVKGILEAYLGGQAVGGAVADLLYGVTNPSGKLAETFPMRLSDNPSYLNFPGEEDKVEYREGIFVGYRYYDKKQIQPLFPFGHGLSYTSFVYSNLTVETPEIQDTDTVKVHVTVKNTGFGAGKEIVQLYVRDMESTAVRPDKELKEFAKVDLAPGEEKTVTFVLNQRSFAYYSTHHHDWHVETGEFSILIGRSSADIVLAGHVRVLSTTAVQTHYTRNSLLGDLMNNQQTAALLQSVLVKLQEAMGDIAAPTGEGQEMFMAMLKYMPLRNLVSFTQGAFTEAMLSGLLDQLNAGA